MRFRKLAFAMTMISLVTVFTGCTKQVVPQTQTVKTLEGNLEIWSTKNTAKALRAAVDNFKQKYPQVEIKILDMETADIYHKIEVGSVDKTSLPDVVMIEDYKIQYIVKNYPQLFLEVSDILGSDKDKFIKNKLDAVTVNGKMYAIPFEADPVLMFYRKDLFDKAGINTLNVKTWDDYIEAGKKVTKISNQKLIPLTTATDESYRFLLNQLNTSYFDKDGKVILNSEKSQKALELMMKLYGNGLAYSYDSKAALMNSLKNGNVASAMLGASNIDFFMNSIPEQKGKWAVMKVPAFEPGGNQSIISEGNNLAVISSTASKKLAGEFCKFAAVDIETESFNLKSQSLLSSYIPSYDAEVFSKPNEYLNNEKVWFQTSELSKQIPSINYSKNYDYVRNAVIDAEAKIIVKNEDMNKTLDDLQADMESKTSEKNK
ncbi:ABC transporter substrate-binding protein [Clostridium omnivorum]|uniref:Sugar-binding protein n=1 Tax=Clostridium omnivorum TaxID=1604902 RepID=A0ABQ5N7S1_9CLOT|nr:extracellular solute-binding protein [Clostridium sp. E14]GLC31274.1 sugar-binding protein [Clostridium sp. E14]